MARSHPPTLLTLAERTLREECRLARNEHVLVAVSGGGDSTALLHVLARLAPKLGFRVSAHGVDHGLRPEAAAELALAERLAGVLSVPFARTVLRVAPGGNLQNRAREARRTALLAAADGVGATRIATAHHADDRAETVLIRILHGATPSALAVLPASEGRFLRPLIRATKADVLLHLERHELVFASDPSNEERRFLRVRVRKELLPLLTELSPAIVDHLTALADELAALPASATFPVPLKRAHRRAVDRAVASGRTARVRLPRDLELVVDPKAGPTKLVQTDGPARRPRRSGR
ncbi:MAG TPA: tRNA lysidine(34) synthetase TilS [Polyangiaceae bacterium]|nr:tRNA lysidine(34) synthetase TilS [Polyangiaceae bacterium]